MHKHISIRGAREHNLKGIDLELPREKLIEKLLKAQPHGARLTAGVIGGFE